MADASGVPLDNPFRPGAGHMPPHLAGRTEEQAAFAELLTQSVILKNLIITGLRGVGKTVLLQTLKPAAQKAGWAWVGTDLSESATVSERQLAVRILTDLAVWTSGYGFDTTESSPALAAMQEQVRASYDYRHLEAIYDETPGLAADKLKAVLDAVWADLAEPLGKRGVIFAYDEAQSMLSSPGDHEYPISLLLDVFQSAQRKGQRFMLVLTGLPTLFQKLVEARTYSGRMFRVLELGSLNLEETTAAIYRPIIKTPDVLILNPGVIKELYVASGGYPYFVQYLCRELYDALLLGMQSDRVPDFQPTLRAAIRKLDADFFAARWMRATDREREIMTALAAVPGCDRDFTSAQLQQAVTSARGKPVKPSRASQLLRALGDAGLVYKRRHGHYSFAVPMLGDFIRRQAAG